MSVEKLHALQAQSLVPSEVVFDSLFFKCGLQQLSTVSKPRSGSIPFSWGKSCAKSCVGVNLSGKLLEIAASTSSYSFAYGDLLMTTGSNAQYKKFKWTIEIVEMRRSSNTTIGVGIAAAVEGIRQPPGRQWTLSHCEPSLSFERIFLPGRKKKMVPGNSNTFFFWAKKEAERAQNSRCGPVGRSVR